MNDSEYECEKPGKHQGSGRGVDTEASLAIPSFARKQGKGPAWHAGVGGRDFG